KSSAHQSREPSSRLTVSKRLTQVGQNRRFRIHSFQLNKLSVRLLTQSFASVNSGQQQVRPGRSSQQIGDPALCFGGNGFEDGPWLRRSRSDDGLSVPHCGHLPG